GEDLAFACRGGQIHLRSPGTGSGDVQLGPCPKSVSVSLSPDRQWVAMATLQRFAEDSGVTLFHVASNTPVRQLPVRGRAIVRFSPNGNWLVAGKVKDFEIFQTGTWQIRHRIAATNGLDSQCIFAFSPDGKLLALVDRDSAIRLVDVQTAEPL